MTVIMVVLLDGGREERQAGRHRQGRITVSGKISDEPKTRAAGAAGGLVLLEGCRRHEAGKDITRRPPSSSSWYAKTVFADAARRSPLPRRRHLPAEVELQRHDRFRFLGEP